MWRTAFDIANASFNSPKGRFRPRQFRCATSCAKSKVSIQTICFGSSHLILEEEPSSPAFTGVSVTFASGLSFSVIAAKPRRINALSSAVTGCLPAAESRRSRPERGQVGSRPFLGLSGDAFLEAPGRNVARSRLSSGRADQAAGRAQGTASFGISGRRSSRLPFPCRVIFGAASLPPFNHALRTQRHVGNQTGAAVTPSRSANPVTMAVFPVLACKRS